MKLAVKACGSVRRLDAILNYEIKVQRNEEAESKEKIKTQLESTKPKKKNKIQRNKIELNYQRVENLFWWMHLIEVRANKLSILTNF